MSATNTNTSNVGSTARTELDAPPAALARRVDDGRRRELARALHTPPQQAPRIAERLDHMRTLLAKYRAEAIALHARLVALELAGNDNVAPLRRALIESSQRIESIGRLLSNAPLPEWFQGSDRRFARGTEIAPADAEPDPADEWIDQPTLRR